MTREPTEMEARVGNAILRVIGAEEPHILLEAARAAIRAMREPTAEMTTVGDRTIQNYYTEPDDFTNAWRSAVDAASPPT